MHFAKSRVFCGRSPRQWIIWFTQTGGFGCFCVRGVPIHPQTGFSTCVDGVAGDPPPPEKPHIGKHHTSPPRQPPRPCANPPPPVPSNCLVQEPPPGSAVEFLHHFFLPWYWVFHGSGGCRTAIQVCRTTFHVCCYGSPGHYNVPKPKPKPKPKPAPKPNAAPKPGPKGQHRQKFRMVYHRKKGFTSEPVEH